MLRTRNYPSRRATFAEFRLARGGKDSFSSFVENVLFLGGRDITFFLFDVRFFTFGWAS